MVPYKSAKAHHAAAAGGQYITVYISKARRKSCKHLCLEHPKMRHVIDAGLSLVKVLRVLAEYSCSSHSKSIVVLAHEVSKMNCIHHREPPGGQAGTNSLEGKTCNSNHNSYTTKL